MANLIYLPNFQTCLRTVYLFAWLNPHFCGWNQRYLLLRFNICKIFSLDFYLILCWQRIIGEIATKSAFYHKVARLHCSNVPIRSNKREKVKWNYFSMKSFLNLFGLTILKYKSKFVSNCLKDSFFQNFRLR